MTLASSDVINVFPIYEKPDSGRIVCELYSFININLLYYKSCKNRTKKSLTQLSHYCFE